MQLLKQLSIIGLTVLASCSQSPQIDWISTTSNNPWVKKEIKTEITSEQSDIKVSINTENQEQTISGFGGCFNELGWEALALVTPQEKQSILNDLFDTTRGCKFNICRMPLGANDYAVDWYSHNETADDFAMKNFSIDRDKQRLIPYIKAAQIINPDIKVWASPWCPPAWMKKSKHYACRADSMVNDMPYELSSMEELVSRFIMKPEYLQAYALYFSKFIQAYDKEGIEISAIHVQNELNSAQNFPSCVWKPEDMGILIADYLGPQFEKDNIDADIWLGTIERPQIERVNSIMNYPGVKKYVKGFGFQWAGKGAIEGVHANYPDMQLMQTETECGDGSNDWAAAVHTFELMRHYFTNGANSYMYWNMVLDETGKSQWGWKQNSMISIDSKSREITYNSEFYLMKHLSAFVKAGSVKLATAGNDENTLAFFNEEQNSVTVLSHNPSNSSSKLSVDINSNNYTAEMEANSFNTFQIQL